jgi:hypothetical protein
MLMGMRAMMVTMRMRMRRKKHRKPMLNQRKIWRTAGIVSNVDRHECENGDDVDADEEESASPADYGSTQNWEN